MEKEKRKSNDKERNGGRKKKKQGGKNERKKSKEGEMEKGRARRKKSKEREMEKARKAVLYVWPVAHVSNKRRGHGAEFPLEGLRVRIVHIQHLF